MITFQYKARDKSGKLVSGFLDADSEGALVDLLEKKDYITLKITPVIKKQKTNDPKQWFKRKRVKFTDLNIFTRLLFTLQNAGLPILSSLHAIREQTEDIFFKSIIEEVAKDVEQGRKLSSSLEKHPLIFNNLYVNMIHSGELSGRLPEVLERLAVLGEHDEVIRMRIKSSMRYPIIIVCAIIIAFLILITAVVPRFESLFSDFDAELPLPTKILLWLNYAITRYWWMSIIVIGALVVLIRKLIRLPKGELLWNNLILKLPVFGPLLLKLYMSRFCRITGTLLSSGVPILQILDLVAGSINNVIVSNAINGIKESVNAGKGMLKPMRTSGLFPPVVTQMVSAGEETGKLDILLIHVSEYYDSQIDYIIGNMVSLIEPLLIMVMGGAVLLMALGIFMPMWNLMDVVKG